MYNIVLKYFKLFFKSVKINEINFNLFRMIQYKSKCVPLHRILIN